MRYKGHKKYFETAYKTGSDIWTHLPRKSQGEQLTNLLPKGSVLLDIGSGRGIYSKHLAEAGYSVLGLDFEKNIVKKVNSEIKNWGLQGKLKFVEGSVLDIPFVDSSFDGICDFGLLEYLYKEDWEQYTKEIYRVLKPGGYYLNVSMSRETTNFLDFSPNNSESGDVEKYGIHYHFFTKDEIKDIFKQKFEVLEQKIERIDKPSKIVFIETILRKK